MADPPAGRFQVTAPPAQMDEAWRLADAATVAGKRAEFIRWLKEVRYRLAHEADEWGEGRGFLPGLKLETRVGVAGGLVVWYAVDPDRRVVFVQRFRMRGDPGAGVQGGA